MEVEDTDPRILVKQLSVPELEVESGIDYLPHMKIMRQEMIVGIAEIP